MIIRLAIVSAVMLWNSASKADPVQFASASTNPTPFARRQAELHGTTASPKPGDMIAGDVFKPEGTGPFAAIVAMHGCDGWPSTPEDRRHQAEKYIGQGYVFLEVDSYGPRGIQQSCVPTPGNQPADRLGDALGALDWLNMQPFIDGSHVALMGASQGGG